MNIICFLVCRNEDSDELLETYEFNPDVEQMRAIVKIIRQAQEKQA